MKGTYHICLSSHQEVLFRSEADLIIGFNYLAVTALETDSALLADGFLSTHHHEVARTDDPRNLTLQGRFRVIYLPAPGQQTRRDWKYNLERIQGSPIPEMRQPVLRQGHNGRADSPLYLYMM